MKALEVIKSETDLKVLVNIGGDLNREKLNILKAAGVDTICCNLETVNKSLFKKLKPSDSFKQRYKVCCMVKEAGVELSSGILLGIGETEEDRLHHLLILEKLEVEEIPLMRFHPFKGTPMENYQAPSLNLLLSMIKLAKTVKSAYRITVPFPTVDYNSVVDVVKAGVTNIATVIPSNYPFTVKGVSRPQVGILEKLLSVFEREGIVTNVKKPQYIC